MNRAGEKWPIDEAWMDAHRCLLEYVEEHGHLNVPENFQTDDGFALGAWVADQRTRRMRQTIDPGEESELDRLRFVWDEHAESWYQHLDALEAFVHETGHTTVPRLHNQMVGSKTYRLGQWVATQRKKCRQAKLSEHHVGLLESVPEWKWTPKGPFAQARSRRVTPRQSYVQALKRFVLKESHALVPRGYSEVRNGTDLELGRWVSTQRRRFQNGEMKPRDVEELESFLGWVWSSKEAGFRSHLLACKQFAARSGHLDVPGNHTERFVGEQLQLGRFLKDLERRAAEEQLTDPETEALIDLRISSQLRMSEKQPKFVFEDLDEETRDALLDRAGRKFEAARLVELWRKVEASEPTARPEQPGFASSRSEQQTSPDPERPEQSGFASSRSDQGFASSRSDRQTSPDPERPRQPGLRSSRSERQTSPDPERPRQPGLGSSRSERQTSPDPDALTDPGSTAWADLSGNHSTILRSARAAISRRVQTRKQVPKEGGQRLRREHQSPVFHKTQEQSSQAEFLVASAGRDSGHPVPDSTTLSETPGAAVRDRVEIERWCKRLLPDDPKQFGPWELTHRVGRGGQGVLYLGREDDKCASVKVPHMGQATARLEHEVNLLYEVREEPKFFPKLIDGGLEEARPWVALEFIPGQSIDDFVENSDLPERLDKLDETALGVARALRVLHGKDIVHGDITPSNILLTDDDPVIIDFGMAFHPRFPQPNTSGGAGGTPGYQAPESELTTKSDVYGWAATLHAFVNGFPPESRVVFPNTRMVSVAELHKQIQDGLLTPETTHVVCGKAVKFKPEGSGDVRFELIDANGTKPLQVMLRSTVKDGIQRKVARSFSFPWFDLLDELESPTLCGGTLRVEGRLRPGSDSLLDMKDLVVPTSGITAGPGNVPPKLNELIRSALDSRPEERPSAGQIVETLESN